MISPLSGSRTLSLIQSLGRPSLASDVAQSASVAQTLQPPPPPPPRGNGATPQSLFDAMVTGSDGRQTDQGQSDGSTSSLDALLSNLFRQLDTDGDGKLSGDELKSAFAAAASGAQDGGADPASAGTAKSLSESLFNALASLDGTPGNDQQVGALAQKFLSVLTS